MSFRSRIETPPDSSNEGRPYPASNITTATHSAKKLSTERLDESFHADVLTPTGKQPDEAERHAIEAAEIFQLHLYIRQAEKCLRAGLVGRFERLVQHIQKINASFEPPETWRAFSIPLADMISERGIQEDVAETAARIRCLRWLDPRRTLPQEWLKVLET